MGLVHALRASAEAALGDDDGPLRGRAAVDGVRGTAAARRSLDLLEMLRDRTAGNLTEAERDALWTALRVVRARVRELSPEQGVAPAPGADSADADTGPGEASPPAAAATASDPERRP